MYKLISNSLNNAIKLVSRSSLRRYNTISPLSSIHCVPGVRFFSEKNSNLYVCNKCGTSYTKWRGQCSNCQEWNTIIEKPVINTTSSSRVQNVLQKNKSETLMKPVSLHSIVLPVNSRIQLPGQEINRVFGGGIVRGSVTLIGGEPGIGKSTLLLKLCQDICESSKENVLYISAEENIQQIYIRAKRLSTMPLSLYISHETNLNNILNYLNQMKNQYKIVVIDSIQTVFLPSISSSPGSISQVRECSSLLQTFAKDNNVTLFLVGHVTKSGDLAGPRTLEHIVDTVIYLEGDERTSYRYLRGIKNRYGATDEIGMLEMKENGLIEVTDCSSFLSIPPQADSIDSRGDSPIIKKNIKHTGCSVGISFNGSRAIPIEIQSLLCPSLQYPPRFHCIGINFDRVQMLLAVLSKTQYISYGSNDVYVKIAGGINIRDIAMDFPLAVSLIASIKNINIPNNYCFIGEIGLAGDLRKVLHIDQRLRIAESIGFQRCFIPKGTLYTPTKKMTITQIDSIKQALDILIK
ncbi:hypothetical protein WA158_005937 [Blastocystis sp. Blastoise]